MLNNKYLNEHNIETLSSIDALLKAFELSFTIESQKHNRKAQKSKQKTFNDSIFAFIFLLFFVLYYSF